MERKFLANVLLEWFVIEVCRKKEMRYRECEGFEKCSVPVVVGGGQVTGDNMWKVWMEGVCVKVWFMNWNEEMGWLLEW